MNKLYFGKVELSEAMESIVSLFLETGKQFGMETVFSSETNSFHITVFLFDDGDKDTFPYTMYEIKYRERGRFLPASNLVRGKNWVIILKYYQKNSLLLMI
jgi:hypothetical protein